MTYRLVGCFCRRARLLRKDKMSDSDDDVVFIPNPSAKAQLPHARCACETHIFVPPPSGALRHSATKPKNKERCATCFCYVCAVWKSNSELG